MELLVLLAQAEGGQQGPPPWSGLMPIFLMIGMLVLFMFFQSRKQRHQQQELLDSIKKNDEVVTSSGIVGRVVNIKPEQDGRPAEVTLRTDADSNTRVRILKSYITAVLSRGEQ